MAVKFNPLEILADPDNLVCACPETDCRWRGDCKSCVALHRHQGTVPSCLKRIAGKDGGGSLSADGE